MIELITENKKKLKFILLISGIIMACCGYFAGLIISVSNQGGLMLLMLALLLWGIWVLGSWRYGKSLILRCSKAKQAPFEEYRKYYKLVKDVAITSGLFVKPQVYIIEDSSPNVFSVGLTNEDSVLVFTTGLLRILDDDQLKGVVGHEIAHILHKDTQLMTFAAVFLGGPLMILDFLRRKSLRSKRVNGSEDANVDNSYKKETGFIIKLAICVISPVVLRMICYCISDRREYIADAKSVRVLGTPEPLEYALELISKTPFKLHANRVTAPMYLVNPMDMGGYVSRLSDTYVPVAERVRILRCMTNGSDYVDYQNAYSFLRGDDKNIIPKSILDKCKKVSNKSTYFNKMEESLAKKDKRSEELYKSKVKDREANVVTLYCDCGHWFKMRGNFQEKDALCPRCGKVVHDPVVEIAPLKDEINVMDESIEIPQTCNEVDKNKIIPSFEQMQNASLEDIKEMYWKYLQEVAVTQEISLVDYTYKRKSKGWEVFKCPCGKPIQLSPSFMNAQVTCNSCRRKIVIEGMDIGKSCKHTLGINRG